MLRWKDIITYARYGNPEPPRRVRHPEAEWAQLLTPQQFQVLREARHRAALPQRLLPQLRARPLRLRRLRQPAI